jgi:hypothetical protein
MPAAGAPSRLARSAGVVAGAFVLSRILGLAREIILSRLFGTSAEASAYAAAFRIPDLLFLVVMAGSFGSAFIPSSRGTSAVARRMRPGASPRPSSPSPPSPWQSPPGWPTFSPILSSPPSSPPGPRRRPGTHRGDDADPPAFARLPRLGGIAAKGILEGQDRFDLPAFAPVVYNLATIAGALLLGPTIGGPRGRHRGRRRRPRSLPGPTPRPGPLRPSLPTLVRSPDPRPRGGWPVARAPDRWSSRVPGQLRRRHRPRLAVRRRKRSPPSITPGSS